jgi:hypothetical protein
MRELRYVEKDDFTGWRCTGCEWEHSMLRMISGRENSLVEARAEFELHDCLATPRLKSAVVAH